MRNCVTKIFPNTRNPLEGTEKLTCLSQMLLHKHRLIEQSYTGGFTTNPYVHRAVRKLERLIDRHMERLGGQRISMPHLSLAKPWKKTGRWKDIGSELFKLEDRTGKEYCLAPTHEEIVTSLVASQSILSHKSLPLLLYQITTKFRDEPHPKHGLLRGREFLMKDMYVFDEDLKNAQGTYTRVVNEYNQLFDALELSVKKVRANPGSVGGSVSHEFHVESAVGEDALFSCNKCGAVVNSELIGDANEGCVEDGCKGTYKHMRGIELGHAFLLDEKYSKPLEAKYRGRDGKTRCYSMGCYGLGVTRIIGASIEVLSSPDQMRWPRVISPYKVLIIPQKKGFKHDITFKMAENIYDQLQQKPSLQGEIVIDDRTELSIGQRVQLAKGLGYPQIICLGKQALESNPVVELVDMYEGTSEHISCDRLCSRL